jgi:hypothetical protein
MTDTTTIATTTRGNTTMTTITYRTQLFRAIDDVLDTVPCETREQADDFQGMADKFLEMVKDAIAHLPQLHARLEEHAATETLEDKDIPL